MKPRKVILTIEVETDMPLAALKRLYDSTTLGVAVHQVAANVIREKPKKRR